MNATTRSINLANGFINEIDRIHLSVAQYVGDKSARIKLASLYVRLLRAEAPVPRLKKGQKVPDSLKKEVSGCSNCINKLTSQEMKTVVEAALSNVKAHRAELVAHVNPAPEAKLSDLQPNWPPKK